jgi:lipoprotein-anchoring transpeptidase ErfK/SrfK
MSPFPRLLLIAAALLGQISCRTPYYEKGETLEEPKKPEPIKLFEWSGTGVPGKTRIKIDLSEQKATFTKDGKPVGWCYVATGTEGHRTPTGSFSISERVVDKKSNKYGVIQNAAGEIIDNDAAVGREKIPEGCKLVLAPMPFWMRITNYGVGMHYGVIPNPGSPASHGCIRMPYDLVSQLFYETKNGTPVIITQ